MALSLERSPMHIPVVERFLSGRSQANAEARLAYEQQKADALGLRNAALGRIPQAPDNFPFPKTPYQLRTPSLGGNTEIIVDTKHPDESDLKIRFPAKQARDRYLAIGMGTLNIDTFGNLVTTFLEHQRLPLPYKTMKKDEYEIRKSSVPASVTHNQLISIISSVSSEGTVLLSPAAESYVRDQSRPILQPDSHEFQNIIMLHPPTSEAPAA